MPLPSAAPPTAPPIRPAPITTPKGPPAARPMPVPSAAPPSAPFWAVLMLSQPPSRQIGASSNSVITLAFVILSFVSPPTLALRSPHSPVQRFGDRFANAEPCDAAYDTGKAA